MSATSFTTVRADDARAALDVLLTIQAKRAAADHLNRQRWVSRAYAEIEEETTRQVGARVSALRDALSRESLGMVMLPLRCADAVRAGPDALRALYDPPDRFYGLAPPKQSAFGWVPRTDHAMCGILLGALAWIAVHRSCVL